MLRFKYHQALQSTVFHILCFLRQPGFPVVFCMLELVISSYLDRKEHLEGACINIIIILQECAALCYSQHQKHCNLLVWAGFTRFPCRKQLGWRTSPAGGSPWKTKVCSQINYYNPVFLNTYPYRQPCQPGVSVGKEGLYKSSILWDGLGNCHLQVPFWPSLPRGKISLHSKICQNHWSHNLPHQQDVFSTVPNTFPRVKIPVAPSLP